MPLRLEFAGSPAVAASRGTVWERLIDPHFVAQAAPGVESVRAVAPGRFEIVSAIGIGPAKLRLTIQIEMFDLIERQSAKLRAVAHATGSTIEVLSAVRLDDAEPNGTLLHWTATTVVDGALAGLGPRLMEAVARKLTTDFWLDFAERVRTRS